MGGNEDKCATNNQTRKHGRPSGTSVDGPLLRARREAAGLTQEALAESCGLTSKTIQKAESGGPVSQGSLQRICARLDLTVISVSRMPQNVVVDRLARCGHCAPPPPRRWTPRAAETRILRDLLCGEPPTPVCITGPSGIGKTGLARYLADLLSEEFPEGVVWINVGRGGREGLLFNEERAIAEALGFAGQLPDPQSVGQQSYSMAFQQQVFGRRRLLIVDEVGSIQDAQRYVPAQGNASVLLTTHVRHVAEEFDHHVLHLGGFSGQDSRALLSEYLGPSRLEEDPEGTAALLALMAGVPRSLHIAGQVLQRERYTTLRAYMSRIESDPSRHVVPTDLEEDADPWEMRNQSQIASYAQIERLLGAEAWQLFRSLAVFEQMPFSIRFAAAANDMSVEEAAPLLAGLVEHYIVEDHGSIGGKAEPLFRLDTHALWLSRWLCSEQVHEIRERLLGWLPQEARRLASLPLVDQEEMFSRQREIWNALVEVLICRALPDFAAAGFWRPDDSPTCEAAADGATRLLPAVVLPLASLLKFRELSEGAQWLPAGYFSALKQKDLGPAGRLALATGWYGFIAGLADIELIRAWAQRGFELTMEAGQKVDAAVMLVSFVSPIQIHADDAEATISYAEQAVALCRAAGARGLGLACMLDHLAVSQTRTPLKQGLWSRALEILHEALDECPEGDGENTLLRAVIQTNAAMIRHVLAKSGENGERLQQTAHELLQLLPASDPARAHCHAMLAFGGATDSVNRARQCWLDAMESCDNQSVYRLLYFMAQAACIWRLASLEDDLTSPYVAERTCPVDLGSWQGLKAAPEQPISMLVPVEPFIASIDLGLMREALDLVVRYCRQDHRCRLELQSTIQMMEGRRESEVGLLP